MSVREDTYIAAEGNENIYYGGIKVDLSSVYTPVAPLKQFSTDSSPHAYEDSQTKSASGYNNPQNSLISPSIGSFRRIKILKMFI